MCNAMADASTWKRKETSGTLPQYLYASQWLPPALLSSVLQLINLLIGVVNKNWLEILEEFENFEFNSYKLELNSHH